MDSNDQIPNPDLSTDVSNVCMGSFLYQVSVIKRTSENFDKMLHECMGIHS